MITEPDVALTDYGLAVESAAFAYLLHRRGEGAGALRTWFTVFFASISLAALIGGTVHGFFLDEATLGARVLWPTTLLGIGVTTVAAWSLAAWIQFSEAVARRVSIAAAVQFAVYGGVVLGVTQAFAVVIINYLPAALFLLVAFALAYRRTRQRSVLVGLLGLVLTFIASAVQQLGFGLHPVYFNHNALYHAIEAVALFMIFWSARWFLANWPT